MKKKKEELDERDWFLPLVSQNYFLYNTRARVVVVAVVWKEYIRDTDFLSRSVYMPAAMFLSRLLLFKF